MGEIGPDEATATVEWGEEDERRSRWWDRILGREPEPVRRPVTDAAGNAPDAADTEGAAERAGRNRAAISCAVVAVVFAAAAQMLPWARIATGELGIDARNNLGTDRLTLGQLASFQVTAYGIGWLLVFGCAGALLVAPPPARRMLTAASLGVVGGQVVGILGIASVIRSGGDLVRFADPATAKAISYGEGFYCAIAAVVMIVVAVGLANRRARRPTIVGEPAARYDDVGEGTPGSGPIDLTVTPLRPAGEIVGERWSGR